MPILEIAGQKFEFEKMPSEQEIDEVSKSIETETAAKAKVQEAANAPGFQYAKALYEGVPFGKRIVSMIPGGKEAGELIEKAPEPTSLMGKVGKFGGEVSAAAPAIMGAELAIPGKVLAGALGFGAQTAGKASSEGETPLEAVTKGALTTGVTYAGGKVLEAGAKAVGEALKPATEKISSIVQDLYNKAVKPTTAKGSFTKLKANTEKAEEAIHTIIENKNNLSLGEEGHQLPQSLEHFSEAIHTTKNDIFNKYNALQEAATGKGVTINGQGLAQELVPILEDKTIDVVSPGTKKYAADLFERLQNAGELTPKELQDIIKGFNGRLKAYYQNPSPDAYGMTAVDALVANNARKTLDSSIEGATEAGYQALKNKYGALSSIEKDVTRAAQRASNYQNKSLLDFSDIFTGEQMVRGLLTMNPAEFVSGAAGRGIKNYYRALNNPNAVISKMFNKVNRLKQEGGLVEKAQAGLEGLREKAGGVVESLKQREFGFSGKAGSATPKGITPLEKVPLDVRSTLTAEEKALAQKQATPGQVSDMARWRELGKGGQSQVSPLGVVAGTGAAVLGGAAVGNAQDSWKPNAKDIRADGSEKGTGFLGVLKRPDGGVSTELSIGVTMDGREMEIPSLVPTLDKKEIDYLLNGGKPTQAIVKKAVDHARMRMRQGKSVFAGEPTIVDMKKISQIESSNNPEAYNKKSQARGKNQITPIVLKEWNNYHGKEKHGVKDLFNAEINDKIADWYMNKRIPQMLKAKKIKDTVENRLIAYNYGIGRIGTKLPKETRDYIKKYKAENNN